MAKPVILSNGKSWKTQSAAEQHFRDMLGRYRDDHRISDWNDHSDLVALLERYDTLIANAAPKIGVGISHFEKRENIQPGLSLIHI